MKRLVCVSNRISLPRRGTAAGGLAVGLLSALRQAGGTWFGWSGEVSEEPAAQPQVLTRDGIRFATIDLKPDELELYYNGYCNSTLWPLFHYFPGTVPARAAAVRGLSVGQCAVRAAARKSARAPTMRSGCTTIT